MKLTTCAPLGLAAAVLLTPIGEVRGAAAAGSVEPLRSLAVGITEGPDPIPQVVWSPFRWIDDFLPDVAHVYGDAGRPDVSVNQDEMFVVWAWNLAGDRDVVALRYDGEAWGQESFVTNSSVDEVDPRAFVEKPDSIHVVWWVPETEGTAPTVRYSVGHGLDWSVDQPVAVDGRRPSVVVWKDAILVAYERDSVEGGQDVVVAIRGLNGEFKKPWFWKVNRVERLDAVLHVEGGVLWVDWKQSSDVLAYSIWTGDQWSDPETIPWTDPSWDGEQSAREAIRDLVLGVPR